ncbi:MAG: Gfo/Idh/MocA family oxidoreductase [FCB group bacterium]|jgi:predicted dehydrogenase|nr:Gfo/Idh/MocA family oxidoreductase [FCB group bacterium]
MSKHISRRRFLDRCTKTALAAPLILGARAGAQGSPNDRVNVGYIGIGRRAKQLTQLPPDAQIVAVADVNRARFDEFTAGKGCKQYTDYREMLADPSIDAVVVASPDHWHALHVIHACRAGKDVYVEKPASLTVREGRAMVAAARENGRIVQVGSQQRCMPETQKGIELVKTGRVGNIHTVHGANYPSPWECVLPQQPVPEGIDWEFWLGPTFYHPYNKDIYIPRAKPGWISFRPWSGGEMTGWGAHGLDVIQWALGTDLSGPTEVWPEEGNILTRPVTFRYPSGIVVKLDGKGPGGGALFEGDNGQMVVDRARYEILPDGPKEPADSKKNGPDRTAENLKNWIDCIRSRQTPIADIELGHRAATMCHLGNIARWTGRKLTWDPEKEEFPNDAPANAYLQRPMRDPWKL